MDKKILYARISKHFYRATYKTGFYKIKFFRKFDRLALFLKKRFPPIQDDALVCLPKDGVIEIGEHVEQQQMVLPPEAINHFIEQSNYRAIMNFCICRESNGCNDYPRELGCLFIGDAAKGIHPDLARPATKEEAREHIRKVREKGLINIIGKAWMDSVWLDLKPHDKLFTVCSCCPCCCISLAVPHLHPGLTDWFIKMPGVQLSVSDECVGCGACLKACVYEGVKLEGKRAIVTGSCRACGRCVDVCPKDALSIRIDDMDYVQKTIDHLSPRVDIS